MAERWKNLEHSTGQANSISGTPDGPDGEPDNEPEDDPNCLFLHALHDLSDSLRNLHQPQAAKPKKIKVRELDTFDGTNPQKL